MRTMSRVVLSLLALVLLGYFVRARKYIFGRSLSDEIGDPHTVTLSDGDFDSISMFNMPFSIRDLDYVSQIRFIDSNENLHRFKPNEQTTDLVATSVRRFGSTGDCEHWVNTDYELVSKCRTSGDPDYNVPGTTETTQSGLSGIVAIKCSEHACIAQSKFGRLYGASASGSESLTCSGTNLKFGKMDALHDLEGYDAIDMFHVGSHMSMFASSDRTKVHYCGSKTPGGDEYITPQLYTNANPTVRYITNSLETSVVLHSNNHIDIQITCESEHSQCVTDGSIEIPDFVPTYAFTSQRNAFVIGLLSNVFTTVVFGSDTTDLHFGLKDHTERYVVLTKQLTDGAAHTFDPPHAGLFVVASTCEPGQLSSGDGSSCVPCPAGFYCPTPSVKLSCPQSTWSSGSASSVGECSGGCSHDICIEGVASCGAGRHYDGEKCTTCPTGFKCPNGEMEPCPAGQGSDGTGLDCRPCIGGEYSMELQKFEQTGSACESCPIGFECNGEVASPCTGNKAQPNAGKSSCTVECLDSQYVSEKHTETINGVEVTGNTKCDDCPRGFFCNGEEASPCTGSSYAPDEGSALSCPGTCVPGRYITNTNEFNGIDGNIECTDCPAGSECPGDGSMKFCEGKYYAGELAVKCLECKDGRHTNRTAPGLGGNDGCYLCLAGTACEDGDKTICLGDQYSNANGMAKCETCDPGYYIINNAQWIGNTDCTVCPKGYRCPDGVDRFPCEGDKYTDTIMKTICSSCLEGYYTESTDGVANDKCLLCPAGKFCNGNDPAPCEGKGYTSTTGKSTCDTCGYGKYTVEEVAGEGNTYCVDCPAGSECDGVRTKCTGKYYQSSMGQGSCETCDPGYYTAEDVPGEGNTKCLICPVGYECDGNVMTPCTGNTYAPAQGTPSCLPCTNGKYPEATVLGANDKCLNCPRGSECPSGVPVKCTGRTYADTTGLANCLPCDDGKYTSKSNIENGNDLCIACPPGHGCNAVDGSAVKCTGNLYALEGVCKTCDEGFYTVEGEVGRGNIGCLPCPPGYSCDGSTTTKCTGKYFSEEGASKCILCPVGKYTVASNGVNVQCLDCEAGFYCDGEVMRQCEGHYYSDEGASEKCEACEAGSHIVINGNGDHIGCEPCERGHYCDGEDSLPCEDNKYSDVTGAVDCKVCLPGSYVQSSGSGNDECVLCPVGHYCPDGVTLGSCLTNEFTNAQGAIECSTCPVGYYTSPNNDDCLKCTGSQYCPDGNNAPNCAPGNFIVFDAEGNQVGCQPCPVGTECRNGINITDCSGDKFAATTGNPLCSDCLKGSRTIPDESNPSRNIYCQPCLIGMYCPDGKNMFPCTGADFAKNPESERCITCDEGRYTVAGEYGNVDCVRCPVGYSCEKGEKIPCENNFFSNTEELAKCKECKAGQYVITADGLNVDCEECPAGQFCDGTNNVEVCGEKSFSEGSAETCTPCAPGHFIVFDGEMRVGCDECPAGMYCDGEVAEACTGAWYNPDPLASECLPCPVGSYVTADNNGNVACTKCTGNEYCDGENLFICGAGNRTIAHDDAGNSECVECPIGHFCDGTNNATLCVGNQFSNVTGLATCFTCQSGYYTAKNETEGALSGTGNVACVACPAGWFCENGQERSPCGDGEFTEGEGASSADFCSAEFCPNEYTCIGGVIIFEPNKPQSYGVYVVLIVVGLAVLVGSIVAVAAFGISAIVLKAKFAAAATTTGTAAAAAAPAAAATAI